MRLLSLELDRYGPFTDKRLVFRPDARLHVVHGPNEAGKSCSLAALTDLLFGIERTTPYDWLHAGKDLRLGAVIQSRNGSELCFRRRKNKPLLSDLADAALPDGALAPFLGGLTRDVFRRAFGLDAEGLRKSAEDLRHTDGELGAALFSAASGLRGVAEARAALEKEADELFGERKAKDRAFYQALARFEEARKHLKDSETRAGDLKALREQVAGHGRRRQEIRERRATIARELARLARLQRAAPILSAIDDDEARIAALKDLPPASPGTGARLRAALDTHDAAVKAHDEAEADCLREIAALNSIAVDEALLHRADDVERLRTDLGEYRKGAKDLPGVDRELEAAARELAALAARLGISPPEIVVRQPDDASRALLRDLASKGRALESGLETRTGERDTQREALARKQQDRAARPALRDPRPLRERRHALAGVVRMAEQAIELVPALDREAAALAREAAELEPPVGDLAHLAQSGMPSRESIRAVAAQLGRLDIELRDARQALGAAHEESAALTAALDKLSSGGTVPTLELIAAMRAQRDAHWATLAKALFGASDALSGLELHEIAAAFERAKAEADRLADAAAGDAQRVAAHADASRRLARGTEAAQDLTTRAKALEESRAALLADWRTRWASAGIEPAEPGEMVAWRLQVEGLLARLAQFGERRLGLQRLQDAVAAALPTFEALLGDLGLPPSPGLPVPLLAQRIDAEIERLAKVWDDARDEDTLLAELERRVSHADADVKTAAEALATWRESFSAVLPRIGLPGDATVIEADAVLAAWDKAPELKAAHDRLGRRVAGLQRDAGQFESAVVVLAGEIAPDLLGQDPETVLRLLHQRLTAAREARARRGDVLGRLDVAQSAAGEAREALAESGKDVAALALELGVPEDDLRPLALRLLERDVLGESLRTRREELARTAEGASEALLREDIADWNPDEAAARSAALKDEDEELDALGDDVSAQLQRSRDKLDALEDVVDAEVAHQIRRNAEAEMAQAAREWVVLKTASVMLGTSIARQRLGRQEPLMRRAGELFAILTGGSFAGLGQTYDDDDVPHLVGRRADGGECAVNALSEGARDQLYLALRLAYVEDYAARAEPPPFVGDDLFASFDDVRTVHGLRALAAIGETVQPILFTHHRFLADTAVRELGRDVDVIELG